MTEFYIRALILPNFRQEPNKRSSCRADLNRFF